MNLTDLIPSVLRPVAKAVAAFVTVWLIAGVTWLAEATGVPVEDVGLDPNAIAATVTSVLVAVGTWAIANRSKET